MKKLLYLPLFSIFILSCQSTKLNDSSNFDFLKGEWIRSNEKIDRKTVESWKKENSTTYLGCSYTLQNNDTIFQEHMLLTKINDNWVLKVKLNKNSTETTDFNLISKNSNSFTVENQKNDYPKTIKYWKNNKNLNAKISNNGENPIEFIYLKQ